MIIRHRFNVLRLLCACACLAMPVMAHAKEPDITGAWSHYPLPGEPVDAKLMGPAVHTPKLKPPYDAEYAAARARSREADARGEPLVSADASCIAAGMPGMMQAIYPLEVLQTPGQVTVFAEERAQSRRIYLDQKQVSLDDFPPGFYGSSVGHWEGDTLVVDTVGIKPSVQFRDVPHGEHMEIHERIKLVAPDFLQDLITVTDPDYLVEPWVWAYTYKKKPGYKILEYVCDNNLEQVDEKGGMHMKIDKK